MKPTKAQLLKAYGLPLNSPRRVHCPDCGIRLPDSGVCPCMLDTPPVMGGQGRTPAEVESTAVAMLQLVAVAVVAALVVGGILGAMFILVH